MDSGERGMSFVAMTIINPRKEYWQSQGIEPATSYYQVIYNTDWAIGLSKNVDNQLLHECWKRFNSLEDSNV